MKPVKKLWRCPKCGRKFVTRNIYHSCGRWPLQRHFREKNPTVRRLFNALVAAARRNGPVKVLSEKTRIGLQVRVIFAAVTPRRTSLRGHLWLMRPRSHPSLTRVDCVSRCTYLAHFKLERLADFDARFRRLVADSYRVGQQKHLERGAKAR